MGACATHEVAGADDADVLHGHPAVGERAVRRLGGQVDDVLVRVLAELRHVDAEDPELLRCRCHRAQPPSGSKPKPTASVPLSSVPITSVARRTFMPVVTCSGSGVTLIRLARTLVPSQSTTAATKGTGMPGAAKRHDGEGPHLARRRDVDRLEFGALAGGAGVAAVEEAGAARGALVGHQVRVVAQHQVVHQRDLLRHHAPKLEKFVSNYRLPCDRLIAGSAGPSARRRPAESAPDAGRGPATRGRCTPVGPEHARAAVPVGRRLIRCTSLAR